MEPNCLKIQWPSEQVRCPLRTLGLLECERMLTPEYERHELGHPAAPLNPQTCEGVRKGTAGLQNFPQKPIGQIFTHTRKAEFLPARKQAVQTGNIQILDNNTASYREVPHCMAQKESAEEARSPEPGLGEEAGSPHGASSTHNGTPSLLLPYRIAQLLEGYKVISWEIH